MAVVVPALNEARNLEVLLPELIAMAFGQILICDNGSTDDTRTVVERHNCLWVYERRRGYGAACAAGLASLAPDVDVVAFIDADRSDDSSRLLDVVSPILSGDADFMLGVREPSLREPGSMTLPQRIANWLLPLLIDYGWGFRYHDLGPLRAIRRSALERIDMQDRAYGWTIEMQIRAVELGLRIREVPVPCFRRHGRSKISGTAKGVILAAYWILRTCGALWLTKHRRLRESTR